MSAPISNAWRRAAAWAFLSAVTLALAGEAPGKEEAGQPPTEKPSGADFHRLLARELGRFQAKPAGLKIVLSRGRKQSLPFRRPIPAAHLTLEAIVTASGSELSYPPRRAGRRAFTAQALLLPAGRPKDIQPGEVRFTVEYRDAAGKTSVLSTLLLKTRRGKIGAARWTPLKPVEPFSVKGDGARLVLRTEAFDARGQALPSTSEHAAPLGVYAVWGEARLFRPVEQPSVPELFLIAFDTLRADKLGCYGNKRRGVSPTFDALARQGYLFERCYSPSSWTLPAFQALLSGLHPAQLGYGQAAAHDPQEDIGAKLRYGRAANLPHWLNRKAGFYSFASTGDGMLEPWQNNFLKGFSFYWSNPKLKYAPPPSAPGGAPRPEAAVNAGIFCARLDALRATPAPVFGFYHTYEAHTPYHDTRFAKHLPPGRIKAPFGEGDYLPGYRKALYADFLDREKAYIEALYEGDIAVADEALKQLREGIERQGKGRAWIIITADHGEEFWEHGGMSHGHSLYDELLRVPLIIVPPKRLKTGVRITEAVSLLDIFPTVCALLNIPAPPNRLGRSLRALLSPDPEKRKAARLPERPGLFAACGTYHGPMRWALRKGRWKYIRSLGVERWKKDARNRKMLRLAPEELYDLSTDPGEQKNLAGKKAFEARRQKMAGGLRLLRSSVLKPLELSPAAKTLQPPPFDPALLDKLKRLGY